MADIIETIRGRQTQVTQIGGEVADILAAKDAAIAEIEALAAEAEANIGAGVGIYPYPYVFPAASSNMTLPTENLDDGIAAIFLDRAFQTNNTYNCVSGVITFDTQQPEGREAIVLLSKRVPVGTVQVADINDATALARALMTGDIDQSSEIAEILGITGEMPKRQSIPSLATQLAASGALKDRLDQLEAAAVGEPRQLAAADIATTANIALTGAQTIDGIATGTGKRALVKDQTAPAENGVWLTNASGAWTRATDLNDAAEFGLASIYVNAGTVNHGSTWLQFAEVTTVGTSAVSWRKIKDEAGLVGQIEAQQTALDATNARTAPLNFAVRPNGHLQIVDANSAELLGFDVDGRAILRLSASAMVDLRTDLAARGLVFGSAAFPGIYSGSVELLGFDSTGAARFAVSQHVANQVAALLNLSSIYDPVAAGLISASSIFILGDSMTSETVRAAIASGLSGRSVAMLQMGGQTAYSMAVAFGAIPLTVTLTGNQVPASGGVGVTGRSTNILNNGGVNMGSFRCSIGGVPGLMTTDSGGTWTFTRDTSGSAVSVASGVQAVLDPITGTATIPATSAYRGHTVVIRLGRNGTMSTRTDRKFLTLDPLRSIVDYLTPVCARVVIVGPYNGRAKDYSSGADVEPSGSTAYVQMMTLIEEMRREFGPLFFDMRGAAVKNAIYDLGLTPDSNDLADIALDCIPRQLFSATDNIHLNTSMQGWEGGFIAQYLRALGF